MIAKFEVFPETICLSMGRNAKRAKDGTVIPQWSGTSRPSGTRFLFKFPIVRYRVATKAAIKINPPPTVSKPDIVSPNNSHAHNAAKTGSRDKMILASDAETSFCPCCCNISATVPGAIAL
mmetsp:Transcript_14087/g.34130  ORF Transcript_14087/g.34130 Transcript_14087/m.34130 type:complete len:121 (+) Transcript_14087:128-490(+)